MSTTTAPPHWWWPRFLLAVAALLAAVGLIARYSRQQQNNNDDGAEEDNGDDAATLEEVVVGGGEEEDVAPAVSGSGSGASVVEGLKTPKFPSVKDITAPILKPLKPIESGIKSIPKRVAKVEQKLMGGINGVVGHITRGVKFVTNIPSCLLWYLLDALGYAMYAPIALVVWAFSLKWLEQLVWGYVDAVDGLVHRGLGVHPFHFSNEIRNKCYFANLKNEATLRAAGAAAAGGVEEVLAGIGDTSVDDTVLLGYLVAGVMVGAIGWAAVASAAAPSAS